MDADHDDKSSSLLEGPGPPSLPAAGAGALGVVAYALALVAVQGVQFNVVTHKSVEVEGPLYAPAVFFVCFVFVALVSFAAWASISADRTFREQWAATLTPLWPLIFALPVAGCTLVGHPPPFISSVVLILSAGWAAFRVGTRVPAGSPRRWGHPVALGSVVVLILLLTVVHTRLQIRFFEHFMLGHADFGHFTEELKNCLAGRGLRSDSFDNVRLGWHFVPLLYVLVPGYALWPSPVYLMVCGALLVHVVALPAYFLVRRLTGSTALAWLAALSWLLLPSQSRLVYSSTYGFQWIYMVMPLLGIMLVAAVTRYWRVSLLMVVLILLCKETTTALILGWGVYLAVFTQRRKSGMFIAAGSLVYLLLCVKVFIPHFAAEGQYARFDLYGELGSGMGDLVGAPFTQPEVFFGRLFRRQAFYFVLLLLTPMALLPIRGWRMALAAVPTLIMILLLKGEDWLSIKFWHQATVLPMLFFAALATLGGSDRGAQKSSRWARMLCGYPDPATAAVDRGAVGALLVCAALGHYFYAFSPISKAYQSHANATFLHRPDPRMDAVRQLRSELPRNKTVLATERLAAHFTDYRRVYTGRRIRPADFVILDRRDMWDTSGLPRQAERFAGDPQYHLYGEYGSVIVYQHRPETPRTPRE